MLSVCSNYIRNILNAFRFIVNWRFCWVCSICIISSIGQWTLTVLLSKLPKSMLNLEILMTLGDPSRPNIMIRSCTIIWWFKGHIIVAFVKGTILLQTLMDVIIKIRISAFKQRERCKIRCIILSICYNRIWYAIVILFYFLQWYLWHIYTLSWIGICKEILGWFSSSIRRWLFRGLKRICIIWSWFLQNFAAFHASLFHRHYLYVLTIIAWWGLSVGHLLLLEWFFLLLLTYKLLLKCIEQLLNHVIFSILGQFCSIIWGLSADHWFRLSTW